MKYLFFMMCIFLFKPHAHAEIQSAVKTYKCDLKLEDRKALLHEFELSLSQEGAQISVSGGATTQGHFNESFHSDQWLQLVGFKDLIREYDANLIIPKNRESNSPFQIKLIGRGDVYFTEDYVCQ